MKRKIALFSDVHANLHALKAVLGDIEAEGVQEMACLGDLVGYAAFPNEVVALIRERNIPCIRGNYDDGVGWDRKDCGCFYKDPVAKELGNRSFEWTKARTTAENRAFLASLPLELRWEVEGLKVQLVHGSPRRINEYLYVDRSEESFARIARQSKLQVIAFGHTHRPFHKLSEGVHFINVGTAGKPVDGDPRVGYALVTFSPPEGPLNVGNAAGSGKETVAVEVQFKKVDYDFEAAAKAIETAGLPLEFAALLRTGGATDVS
jgi:putative phosphoesterase